MRKILFFYFFTFMCLNSCAIDLSSTSGFNGILLLVGGCIIGTIFYHTQKQESTKDTSQKAVEGPSQEELIDKWNQSSPWHWQYIEPRKRLDVIKKEITCMSPTLDKHNILYWKVKIIGRNNTALKNLKRGECVFFKSKPYYPEYDETQNTHKRLIGLPGDHIQGKIEDGKAVIYINGEKLAEPYVNKQKIIYLWNEDTKEINRDFFDKNKKLESHLKYLCKNYNKKLTHCDGSFLDEFNIIDPSVATEKDIFEILLKEDEIYVLGDNRYMSYDSREIGPVKLDHVIGKAEYIFNPFKKNIFKSYKNKFYEFLSAQKSMRLSKMLLNYIFKRKWSFYEL